MNLYIRFSTEPIKSDLHRLHNWKWLHRRHPRFVYDRALFGRFTFHWITTLTLCICRCWPRRCHGAFTWVLRRRAWRTEEIQVSLFARRILKNWVIHAVGTLRQHIGRPFWSAFPLSTRRYCWILLIWLIDPRIFRRGHSFIALHWRVHCMFSCPYGFLSFSWCCLFKNVVTVCFFFNFAEFGTMKHSSKKSLRKKLKLKGKWYEKNVMFSLNLMWAFIFLMIFKQLNVYESIPVFALTRWMTRWMTDWLTDCLTYCLTCWLIA